MRCQLITFVAWFYKYTRMCQCSQFVVNSNNKFVLKFQKSYYIINSKSEYLNPKQIQMIKVWIAKLGLYQKLTYEKAGLDVGGLMGKFIPKKQREMYGLVLDNEIDIVLDASGFAHGDQWGVKNTKKLLNMSKRWKKSNTKLILLPQAFGPFNKQETKKNMKELIDNTTLIFAREDLSYNYITSITDKKNIIEVDL